MNFLRFIQPPRTNYTSLIEIGKFNMVWNVSIVLFPIFITLLIIHIALGDISWITSILALLLVTTNILLLDKTRKYNLAGWNTVMFGVFICQFAIYVVDDSRMLADAMWCILVAFFTFFLFGNKAGTIILLINLSGLMFYEFVATPDQLVTKGITSDMVDYKMVINVYYVAFALAFVIGRMQLNNKEVNDRYEEQIRHNEVLFKEVHHRVKNNLQIMASLLRLQAAEASDEGIVRNLNEAIGRVQSMAFIHEKMYQKENLAELHFQEYLNNFIYSLLDQIDQDKEIDVKISCPDLILNPDAVVSISLLINELITNSIKHAFVGNSGTVNIEVTVKDDLVKFVYHDDGSWKEPSDRNTFGRELIGTLIEHLEGVSRLKTTESGTYYFIDIPAAVLLKL